MVFVPFSFITNMVSSILKTVVNIFFAVLVSVIRPVVEIVLALLQEILNAHLYQMTFLPMLYVLETLQEAVEIFAGMRPVSYFGSPDNLYNIVLFRSGVSKAFWAITLIGLIIAVAATILSFSKAGSGEGHTVSAIMGRLGRTCITFLMVPFVTMCCINLTSLVFIKADEAISMSSGYGSDVTIPKVLFATTTMGAERDSSGTQGGLLGGARAPYFSGAKDYRHTFTVFGQGKELDPNAAAAVEFGESKEANTQAVDNEVENIKSTRKYPGGDFDIAKMNVALGIIEAIYFIFLYCAAILLFLMRLMEITILYAVSPLFTGSIPFDDGEKFGQWREVFIAKLISGFGLILGLKIYTIVLIPLVMDPNVLFIPDYDIADAVLRILLLAGFGFAVYKCFSILTQIVHPQLAFAEAAGVSRVVNGILALVTSGTSVAGIMTAKGALVDQNAKLTQIQKQQDALKK